MAIKDYSILLLCAVFLQCNANLNATILTLFSKQLGVPQPLPISFNAPRETKVALTKAAFCIDRPFSVDSDVKLVIASLRKSQLWCHTVPGTSGANSYQ